MRRLSSRGKKCTTSPRPQRSPKRKYIEPQDSDADDSQSNDDHEDKVPDSPKSGNKSHTESEENGSNSVSNFNTKHKADEPSKEENDKSSKQKNDSEEEAYEVECIIDSRYMRGKHQYKIRWQGFSPDDDTWENEDNLDCSELIKDFEKAGGESSKPIKKRSSSSTGAAPKSPPKKNKGGPSTKKTKEKKEEDDGTEWEVSKIVDSVELKDGTRQFLVRWKGYSASHNSWEPQENLNCVDLIEKYLSAEKIRETVDRECREVRPQVNRYNPELTKRQSSRTSSKKRMYYYDQE